MLLGSRLQSNEHVFAFILLAIEIFALFPIFQREVKVSVCVLGYSVPFQAQQTLRTRLSDLLCLYLSLWQRNSERAHLVTAVALFVLSTSLTWPSSRLLSVVSALFIVFLSLVCPLWFMHVQEYKKCVVRGALKSGVSVAVVVCTWHCSCLSLLLACVYSEILGPWDIAHIQPEQ